MAPISIGQLPITYKIVMLASGSVFAACKFQLPQRKNSFYKEIFWYFLFFMGKHEMFLLFSQQPIKIEVEELTNIFTPSYFWSCNNAYRMSFFLCWLHFAYTLESRHVGLFCMPKLVRKSISGYANNFCHH